MPCGLETDGQWWGKNVRTVFSSDLVQAELVTNFMLSVFSLVLYCSVGRIDSVINSQEIACGETGRVFLLRRVQKRSAMQVFCRPRTFHAASVTRIARCHFRVGGALSATRAHW
jgi:hypothetical protein